MLYWIKVLDALPVHTENGKRVVSSQCKEVYVSKELPACALISLLSSSLFFWFYQTFSDCQQINKREFGHYRFDLAEAISARLKQLGAALMEDYKKNSRIVERIIRDRTALVKKEYFRINQSKPIFDKIDVVLAGHYRFTDEELDFITNYDIKYRMGLCGGSDDDSDE